MTELHTLNIKTSAGPAVLGLAREGRTFSVMSFAVKDRPELCLAFLPKGVGVEDLDKKSDVAQCFNLSNRVRYGDVVLGSTEMRAASRGELEYALDMVKVAPFNREEI